MTIYGEGTWKFQAFDGCPAYFTNKPPNWFHRAVQRLFMGFRWTKE